MELERNGQQYELPLGPLSTPYPYFFILQNFYFISDSPIVYYSSGIYYGITYVITIEKSRGMVLIGVPWVIHTRDHFVLTPQTKKFLSESDPM